MHLKIVRLNGSTWGWECTRYFIGSPDEHGRMKVSIWRDDVHDYTFISEEDRVIVKNEAGIVVDELGGSVGEQVEEP